MTQSHSLNHINRLELEGGGFVIRLRDLTKPRYKTLAPRKFIGLRSEMDEVIRLFDSSNGDLNVIVNKLDLGDTYLEPGDKLFYVKFDYNRGFRFDLPNGNEDGAYPGLWRPGGYTKSGTYAVSYTHLTLPTTD